jgi:hypothetical protein
MEELSRLRSELKILKAQYNKLQSDYKAEVASRPSLQIPDRASQFRAQLRRLSPLIVSVEPYFDPKTLLAVQEFRTECERLQIYRLEDPGTYGKCLAEYYDLLIEGMNPPCPANQKDAVSRILADAASRFSRISEETTGDRLLAELRLEAEVHDKLAEQLGQPFQSQIRGNSVCGIFAQASTKGYLGMPSAAQSVAVQWGIGLGIDHSQFSTVERIAAEFMEDAYARQCKMSGTGYADYGTQEGFSIRGQALQAQIEALRHLSPFLTSDQQDKLKSLQMREYLFYKPPPGDK